MGIWNSIVKLFDAANLSNSVSASTYVENSLPSVTYNGSGADGSKYQEGLPGSGVGIQFNGRALMVNARTAYHESPPARAIVERYADTVVGSGLRLNPTPQYDILNISPENAEKWANYTRESFNLYAISKKASLNGTQNLYQMMRAMEVFTQRDGEYYLRQHFGQEKNLQNPLQLSFIDPLQIQGGSYVTTEGYQYLGDGIERDKNGKEIAYNVCIRDNITGNFENKRIPAVGSRSGLKLMFHCFRPEYADQGKGLPRIGHILQECSSWTDFTLAQVYQAINQSNIAMYVKPSKDNPASNPTAGISHLRPSGPIVDTGESFESTSSQTTLDYVPIQEATLKTPGSLGVFSLSEGEDLNTLTPSSPSENFSSFVDAFTSYLAASVGMPLEVLLIKFNSNYSASRAALIMFWRVAEILREDKKADCLDYIYESWLIGEIAAGRISCPGWENPRLRAAWLHNSWLGSSMPNLDPVVTAKAHDLEIKQGSTTLDEIARDTNGSSGKANRLQLTRELAELPIPHWEQKPGTGNDAAGDAEDEKRKNQTKDDK